MSVSKCCRVPTEPEEPEEEEFRPCYFCEGNGWIIGHDYRKHTCPVCHGRGEEE